MGEVSDMQNDDDKPKADDTEGPIAGPHLVAPFVAGPKRHLATLDGTVLGPDVVLGAEPSESE